MANELISFEWEVYEGGYRTISGERQKGGRVEDALIEDLSLVKPAEYRCYSPLTEHTGLFRTFATTALTSQGIKAFADAYGLLGIALHYRVFDEPPFDRGGDAEPLEDWRSAIVTMKAALDLWDMLRKTRTADDRGEDIVRFLNLHAETFDSPRFGPIAGQPRPRGGLQDAEDAEMDQFDRDWEGRNWRGAGWFHLRQLINGHLKRHAAPMMRPRPKEAGLALSITPFRLLGGLWLQVAEAVNGNLQYRMCEEPSCGKSFEVSTRIEGKRKNREYCSDACRQKTYRRRKRQARTLAAEGHTIEAIAQRLDSDLETVRDGSAQVCDWCVDGAC